MTNESAVALFPHYSSQISVWGPIISYFAQFKYKLAADINSWRWLLFCSTLICQWDWSVTCEKEQRFEFSPITQVHTFGFSKSRRNQIDFWVSCGKNGFYVKYFANEGTKFLVAPRFGVFSTEIIKMNFFLQLM